MTTTPFPCLALAALAACGCSSSSSPDDAPSADLAASDHAASANPDLIADDLAILMPDLAVAPDMAPLDCAGLIACTRTCKLNNAGTCVPACIARGSNAALVWFQPLEQCAGPACSQSHGAPPPCSDPGSQACIACVMQFCASEFAACSAH